MSTTDESTGNGKLPPPRGAKDPMTLAEALEFLRSALHYIALTDTEITVENDDEGWLRVGIRGAVFIADASGDIFFKPISPQISCFPKGNDSIATASGSLFGEPNDA